MTTLHLLPEKEIQDLFNLQDSLSQVDFINIIDKISFNLESIHLSVFTLEQKQSSSSIKDIEPLEEAMLSLEPFIISLSDLNEIMFNKGINKGQQIMKIQSEWSSLQHFLTSVKKQLMKSNDEKELISIVENLLLKMDDISLMIFDFQEKKHIQQQQQLPTSSSSEVGSESTTTTDYYYNNNNVDTKLSQSITKEDQLIIGIDTLYDPLLQQIDQVYQRINQLQLSSDSILSKRCVRVKEKWESLQYERDELKFEHKEDRWLAVFRRVADQVDVMIDGLDRSVVQCYSIIQQVKDSNNNNSSNVFDKFSKSFLRSFQSNKSTTPIDKEKFKSIEKSFEAKYKYYTPSIDRMLTMLGNGISARASRDNQTSQRHDSMIQRWYHLKEVMDELRLKDLIEADRIINYNTHSTHSSTTSSIDSRHSNSWKGIRYKTPEPQHDRSITPTNRSRKNNNDFYHQQSLLRGSLSDSSSVGSSSPRSTRQTKTPRPTRNGSITTQQKKEDFYDEDERYYGVDLMKLNNTNNRPPSSNHNYNMRSASTLERKRSQDRPLLNTARSKTPNPPSNTPQKRTIRSKSSMGDLMMNRVMSPRSVTPSLIPRPKTPKEEQTRSTSPMIPRPKSQLRHNNNTNKPPPVPPIPKYVISHENDYAAYRDPLRKKQSMPILNNNNNNNNNRMEISFHEDSVYRPDPKDPLDLEVAHIVNASPISIKCSRAQPGRYYFGNELSMSSMGGKKMYTCKLMTYNDRRGGQFKNNKVLIRVGGGWQDLEFFLLEHSSLMASDVVVRSFGGNRNNNY